MEAGYTYINDVLSQSGIRMYNKIESPWFLLTEICEVFGISATKSKRILTEISEVATYIINNDLITNAGIKIYDSANRLKKNPVFVGLPGLVYILSISDNMDAADLHSSIMHALERDRIDLINEVNSILDKLDSSGKVIWQMKKKIDELNASINKN